MAGDGALLRPDVLAQCTVALGGGGERGAAAAAACAALGAGVVAVDPGTAADPPPGGLRAVDLLICDTAEAFGRGGHDGLRDGLDAAFNVTRAVARAAWIEPRRPGRIVLIAPDRGAGEHAGGLRAGLENLARTLSTEWARHGVTAVAVLPGAGGPPHEVAQLCVYLASPAGAYHSGCAFTLA